MSKDHNSNIVGKVLYEYQTLSSTNDEALSLIKKGVVEEGTLVTTQHQTKGRGQMGTIWQSDPGENITISVVLKPGFLEISEQFYLNKAVCVALRFFLSDFIQLARVKIKWPNDLYIDDHKIAGVLIQNVLQGHIYQWAVIGIGLNVHQCKFGEDLINPTSLSLVTGQQYHLDNLKSKLYEKLDLYYREIKQQKRVLDDIYTESLYKVGQIIDFHLPDGASFKGSIVGVEESGALKVSEVNGIQHKFRIKEIRY
ncbi:MAG: biotin--[acetyl-CoA-carboxylase] ligase [Saprospiraceae bacterium]|nr:biotin--[acetyl-CoA-carboxylase] ligase [Saprospiraceae bacterium]